MLFHHLLSIFAYFYVFLSPCTVKWGDFAMRGDFATLYTTFNSHLFLAVIFLSSILSVFNYVTEWIGNLYIFIRHFYSPECVDSY